jgi:superfamily II DNA/RNA helicase
MLWNSAGFVSFSLCSVSFSLIDRVLILLPTRELAVQCYDVFISLSKYIHPIVGIVLVVGGVPLGPQTYVILFI